MQAPNQDRHRVWFPADPHLEPDQEWCEVLIGGERSRVRFHDYGLIYQVPGLYEHLFHDLLACASPSVVSTLLAKVLRERGVAPDALRVLEVGAGNGLVGEELARHGVTDVVALDVSSEAAAAAARDRPHVYSAYHVADLAALPAGTRRQLAAARFNCLISVSALGFDDIPANALGEAMALLTTPALVAFTLHERYLRAGAGEGFRRLFARREAGTLVPLAWRRYQHRLSAAGSPLHYVACVAERRVAVPATGASK